jgi:hypothetical protein
MALSAISETELVTANEIAATFKVVPKTVGRWVASGKLPEPIDYPGGHRRWRLADIQAAMQGPVSHRE